LYFSVVAVEALRVLEPHIVASLTSGCQHVIIIGDHQPLPPSCNGHPLSSKFRMDVARLAVPPVYRQLLNHPSTDQYPPIPSMGGEKVILFDHRGKEQRELSSSSFFNPFETKFALGFSLFFHDQGIRQENITIIVATPHCSDLLKNSDAKNSTFCTAFASQQ